MNNEQNIDVVESIRTYRVSKEFTEFLLREKEKRAQEWEARQEAQRQQRRAEERAKVKRMMENGIPTYALDHRIEERDEEISWDGIFDAYRESCDDWDMTQDIKGMFGNIFA